MARSLAVVAVVGIGVSAICLSLAGLFSPYPGISYPFSFQRPYESRWWESRPWAGTAPFAESGEIVTREFSWDGGDRAEIYIPCIVYYTPGPEWHVTVKGPASSVDHLRLHDGGILFDAPMSFPHTSSLEVRITGPSIKTFDINSSGKLVLENISQADLHIDIRGSGSVRARGTVERLELRIFGSGNAELAELATRDIETRIFGSGNADVAPTGDVEVSIFGSGDLRLHAQPANVSSRIFGSGRVINTEPPQGPSQGTTPDGPI